MSNVTKRIFLSPLMRSVASLSTKIVVAWAVVLGCIIATLIFAGALRESMNTAVPNPLANLATLQGNAFSSDKILVLKIQGVIVGARDSTDFSSTSTATVSGYDLKRQLYAAADNAAIKGVLLEIDSPGGTIYGARAIADGVKYYRDKTKHPVYAHIEGLGASGGYWAAVSTNKIIADYGSDVGSIGVIMGPFEYYDTVLSQGDGVVTEKGIQSIEITAGRSKDIGNPFRKLTAPEQAALQAEVNNEYTDFVAYVSAQRGISADTIRNQLGAMAYGNQTAQTSKLIDGSGSREDALDQLAAAAGVKDDYQVVGLPASAGSGSGLLGALSHFAAPPKVTSTSTCALTRSPLAYSGDVAQLCAQ